MEKQVILLRSFRNDKQTLGTWTAHNNKDELFVAKTLELSWKNNESNISCIPVGVYPCKYTKSNRLSKLANENYFKKYKVNPPKPLEVYTYEIFNVPKRAGIRTHSANYFFQLLGCVALGDVHKDINIDGQLDVIHSGDTVEKFNKFMNFEDFTLKIVEAL